MIEVGDVDVVVHHHDIFRRIGRRAALRAIWAACTAVRDSVARSRPRAACGGAADLVHQDLLHARNAGVHDVLRPDGGGAHHCAVARHLVGPRAHRRHASTIGSLR